MNETADEKENVSLKRRTVDFQYFIRSAVEKKLAWNSLAYFLTDLAPTLDQSREVIKILVHELEKWVSKAENEIKSDNSVPQIGETFEKYIDEHDQDDQQSLASSELSDSEDEIIATTNDISNTPENNVQNINSSTTEESKVTKSEIQFEEFDEKLLDEIGNQFYEFVGDNDKEVNIEEDEEALHTVNEKSPKKPQQKLNNTCESKDFNDIPKKAKEFKCIYCSKAFTKKCILVEHERIHTGEKPFKCKICKKCFIRSYHLKCHESIHNEYKQFQCENCERRFANRSNWRRHIMIHKKPYFCETCKHSFDNSSSLISHARKHNPDNPHKCKTCSKCFTAFSNLKRHEKLHSNEKKFQCKICEKPFDRSDNLKKHKMTMHKLE